MPPNHIQYENLTILKTHSRRYIMHTFQRDLHVPFSGSNKQRVLLYVPSESVSCGDTLITRELTLYLKRKSLAVLSD